MIQIDEQKLRQLFKNRSNCYADAEDVIQAMDEDCFIETVNEALRQPIVIKSVCEHEPTKNIIPNIYNETQCKKCGEIL